MLDYSLSQVRDEELLRNLKTLLADDRATTAQILAHIAEVDARKLYLPAAHSSMYSYCVHELGLSEDAAFKRIHAARAAREFAAIFQMVADGRLHLSGVVLLAPRLTRENAADLLAAAAGKTKAQIERLLAERFARPDVPERLEPIATAQALTVPAEPEATFTVNQHAPGRVDAGPIPAKVTPLSAEGFELKATIDCRTHEKLLYAQALLGRRVSRRAIAQVFELALDALIARLEKQKFGGTSRPRPAKPRSTDNPRYVPLAVRREIWERDSGQCTYVSESGQRCLECSGLEFDHVLEVARAGQATVENLRLRCRAHNQHTAEQAFGKGFMDRKRREAVAARKQAEAAKAGQQRARASAEEVIPWLRQLGIRPEDARRAAALCERIPEASLEERVRLALSACAPRAVVRRPVAFAAA